MARVLIADDEPAERRILGTWLEAKGHAVRTVADGAAALDALAAEPFDVVIADILMPVMDGIALALAAARDHPGVKLVLVTAHETELARARNLEALVAHVVAKPFRLAHMSDLVETLTAAGGAIAADTGSGGTPAG
jgi:CheY-like chemotaxis protein